MFKLIGFIAEFWIKGDLLFFEVCNSFCFFFLQKTSFPYIIYK